MPLSFRIILLVLGLGLCILIVDLVRRGRFREELSLIWLFVGVAFMGGAFADLVIDPIAKRLGVDYPPALVFALLIFCLVVALLYFSTVISDLKSRVKELAQIIALDRRRGPDGTSPGASRQMGAGGESGIDRTKDDDV